MDSTRFGKSFPDAFNRTVPLWCAVMNRAFGFTKAKIELPDWLATSEIYRISEAQLDDWAQEVRVLCINGGEEDRMEPAPFEFDAAGETGWSRADNSYVKLFH